MAEQRLAIGNGILPRPTRDHKHVVDWADPTPQAGRNTRRFDPDIVDVDVRYRIGQLRRALHGVRVKTALEQLRLVTRVDRGAGDTVGPRHQLAARIESGRQAV